MAKFEEGGVTNMRQGSDTGADKENYPYAEIVKEIRDGHVLAFCQNVMIDNRSQDMMKRFDLLIEELRKQHVSSDQRFQEVIRELKKSNVLSEVQEVIRELKKSNVLSEVQNTLIKQTLEANIERTDKLTFSMRQFINNTTKVQEADMSRKLAEIVPRGNVIATSYDLKEDNQKIVDIDGMVTGTWEGQEVVIFMEVKSFLNSNSLCRDAMSQLGTIKRYWEELITGFGDDFSALHGDEHKRQAYIDLKVEEHGHRRVLYAFGANVFSESAKKYFRKLKMRPICITGDWGNKYVPHLEP